MPPTLLGADGRPLTVSRPRGSQFGLTEWFSQPLTEWTDRWTDAVDDVDLCCLKSFDQIYRSQPVVAAVVNKIARRVATLPFGAFRLAGTGAREPVLEGTLRDLIAAPWPRGTSLHLNHHVALSLLVHGNALVGLVRENGPDAPPTGLWPLDWARVSAYGMLGGPVEWWSTSQFGVAGERFIRAGDVLHFAWSAPSGQPIGVSPLEQLGVTLRLDDAAQRHQVALFRNGSRPSMAVTVDVEGPTRPTEEELEYARGRVEATHKGPDNSGRWVFMGPNVKVSPLSMTPVEVQLIDQRRRNEQEVGMVYDLAGPLRGDLENGTMANVEEMLKSLYRDVLPPWTELIVQTYQSQLIDPHDEWAGNVLRFDFTDKLKGEPKELAETLKTEVEAGLRTRNEARVVLGLAAGRRSERRCEPGEPVDGEREQPGDARSDDSDRDGPGAVSGGRDGRRRRRRRPAAVAVPLPHRLAHDTGAQRRHAWRTTPPPRRTRRPRTRPASRTCSPTATATSRPLGPCRTSGSRRSTSA
jgi:HK97 family phage portal protein